MTVRVEQGDALNLVTVEDESVDLVVTSPPYFALRVYKDSGEVLEAVGNEDSPEGYLKSLDKFMEEMWRVLKPSGSVFVVLGDKFAGSGGHNNNNITDDADRGPKSYNKEAGVVRPKSLMGLPWRFAIRQIDAGWILRQELIWSKPNGMPESVRDRCRRSHEQVFHFTKNERYYAAVDRIRTPNKDLPEDWEHIPESKEFNTGENMDGGTAVTGNPQTSDGLHRQKGGVYSPLGSLPRSVWEISTSGLRIPKEVIAMFQADKHYAAYPPELVKRIVEGWSPEGICTVCGEGRVPVVKKTRHADFSKPDSAKGPDAAENNPQAPAQTTELGKLSSRGLTDVELIGEACACTPRVNNTGKRGDWKDNRTAVEDILSDDWEGHGIEVPRRPGGFGTKIPPPEKPRIEYQFDDWTPPPTTTAVVLDPFGGVGTTALVASLLNRDAITIDLSAGYTRLAAWRLFISDHGPKLLSKWAKQAKEQNATSTNLAP